MAEGSLRKLQVTEARHPIGADFLASLTLQGDFLDEELYHLADGVSWCDFAVDTVDTQLRLDGIEVSTTDLYLNRGYVPALVPREARSSAQQSGWGGEIGREAKGKVHHRLQSQRIRTILQLSQYPQQNQTPLLLLLSLRTPPYLLLQPRNGHISHRSTPTPLKTTQTWCQKTNDDSLDTNKVVIGWRTLIRP